MPDDPTPPAGGGDPTPPVADKTFTQADLDRIVGERLAREQAKYADYDDLKTAAGKLAELEAANQTEAQRIAAERDTYKTTAEDQKTAAEKTAAENLRLRVAMSKKLPAELVDRLKGATKEELEADADSLLKLVQAPSGGWDGGPRGDGAPSALPDDASPLQRLAHAYK